MRMRISPQMNGGVSFREYYSRFFRALAIDATPWARDNIGFAGVMALSPLAAVWIRDPHHSIDWAVVRTTLWLYLAASLIYLAYYCARTAWRLDAAWSVELESSHQKILDFKGSLANRICAKRLLVYQLPSWTLIYERLQNAPMLPQKSFAIGDNPAAWWHDMGEQAQRQKIVNDYERDTLGIYEYRFKRSVLKVIAEMKDRGYFSGY